MEKKEWDTEKIEPKEQKETNRGLRTERKSLLAIFFVILFTIYDILIAEGLLRYLHVRHNMPIFYLYWIVSYVFLIPLFIILISFRLRSWRFLMYSVVGIYCGWLDILFFPLQGNTLPNVYTWWPLSPSSLQLILFATTTLIVALFIDLKVKDLSPSTIGGDTQVGDG
ncbi:hypothetical protein AMJ50_02575 [Parcubacteria bacterium DG_74_3]|nr:MAG: hypothetical protein AMJ50_02575 [Parcubacteria bacterium DG_74_3]